MNPKWFALAAELLELASEHFSNHGCNDWEWPKDWTEEDRTEFAKAVDQDNEGTDFFTEASREKYGPPDWLVMSFLADQIRQLASNP